ncbi:nitrile hydratase accessory protein [Cupriavidus sp. CV2]|uniref:nitrile hydratase accessory protein n=1 Tax=Cupriavidus ulmosensis TaxID=3065913 RepID=UPI00296B30C5|nr:nitrile hydratase accessory protein [Cupriavidus sp. CV2]MDW3683460.1 nitrile hydratase accessory protein [Cupriavidus sp. CV2]
MVDPRTASTTPANLQAIRAALPALPCDSTGPIFREPWEAQAFALALALHERGAFTWTEWAATLSQVIREAQAGGDPDNGEHYYRFWLTALERLAAAKGLVDGAALLDRRDAWDAAARRTPHGQPIELD